MSDLDKLLENSDKAEFMEMIGKELEKATKGVVVLLVEDGEGYRSITLTFGVTRMYEAIGILESGKNDLVGNDHQTDGIHE